ncbi:MAG: dihydroneopterin aldolase [Magnetococcales bacterium]|nr:dihydroneopterin aldolase [Magnetococcales bacterium]NGZ07318.1 dihydroneopterin aldolase [Magnetococcales bacterium]
MPDDLIRISDLTVHCVIGIQEWERLTRQEVRITLTLTTDTRSAGTSDRIDDTIDYKALTKQIIAHAEHSTCLLVEALAEQIATLCLTHPRVEAVQVTVEKPGALRYARSVGVTIKRCRDP